MSILQRQARVSYRYAGACTLNEVLRNRVASPTDSLEQGIVGALGGSDGPLDQCSSRRSSARRAVCSLDNDPTGTLLVTIRQVRHLMGARDEQRTWYTEAAE